MSVFAPIQNDDYGRGTPTVGVNLAAVPEEQRAQFEQACLQGLRDAEQQGMRFAKPVEIIVKPDAKNTIREFGVAGATLDAGAVQITFDPARMGEAGFLPAVSRLVTHELNHEWRTQQGHNPRTLGELLVSEGLAQVAEEAPGHAPGSYTRFKDAAFRDDFISRAKDNLSKEVDFMEWFFGEPRHHGGYALGRELVRGYLQANNLSATQAHDIKAGDVLADWTAGKFTLACEETKAAKPAAAAPAKISQ